MPTYEYHCPDCGKDFELFQGISEKTLSKCPSCGRRKVHRIISGGVGIVFKGSGFYETDYKRGAGSEYSKSVEKEKGGSPAEKKPDKEARPAEPSAGTSKRLRKTEKAASAGPAAGSAEAKKKQGGG